MAEQKEIPTNGDLDNILESNPLPNERHSPPNRVDIRLMRRQEGDIPPYLREFVAGGEEIEERVTEEERKPHSRKTLQAVLTCIGNITLKSAYGYIAGTVAYGGNSGGIQGAVQGATMGLVEGIMEYLRLCKEDKRGAIYERITGEVIGQREKHQEREEVFGSERNLERTARQIKLVSGVETIRDGVIYSTPFFVYSPSLASVCVALAIETLCSVSKEIYYGFRDMGCEARVQERADDMKYFNMDGSINVPFSGRDCVAPRTTSRKLLPE